MTSTVVFKANVVRTISSPSQEGVTTYFVYVNFRDVPENLPMDVNPRKPNMKTAVAKELIDAVKSPETDFDINNRGIVVVAKDFKFNTSSKLVNLDLGNDPKRFGILDGGHTYSAIIQYRNELSDTIDKFVKFEIIIGKDITVSRIADARNTSVQVSDIALYELDDKFQFIKQAVKNETYANDIAIKDNSKKRLPVIELLKLLFAYNVYHFKDNKTAPTQAYSGKSSVFKDFKQDLDENTGHFKRYEDLAKLLPKLVKLYDYIEVDFPNKYLNYKSSGKFGAVRGIEARKKGQKPFKTLFLENNINYKISYGYILPVFGAFRALIDPTDLSWRLDPFKMWDEMGSDLIKNTLELSHNIPQDAGKNASIWTGNYRTVENEMLHQMLDKNALLVK